MTTLPVMPQASTPTPTTPTEPTAVPAAAPASSGVIDPPVAAEEASLVDSMLQYMDGPASDDYPQEDIVESVVAPSQPGIPPPPQQLGEPPAPPSIEPAPPVQVQPQVPPVAPVVAPVVPAQPVAAAPVVPGAPPVTPPGQPPAVPQGATAPQPVPPGQELETLRQGLEAQRETIVKQLAQSYSGTFTDQDIEAIQGPDPAAAKQTIAAMAARIHTDIVQNVMGIFSAQMPVMIGRMLETKTVHDRATQEFYGQYPDLKGHESVVNQVAASVRQMHPKMESGQFTNMVAAMVRVSCGLQGVPAAQPPQPVPQQPIIRQPAFQPVAPTSRAPAALPVGQQGNQWGLLNEILQQDERGAFDIPG